MEEDQGTGANHPVGEHDYEYEEGNDHTDFSTVHVPNFADVHLGGDHDIGRAEMEAEEVRESSKDGEIELLRHLPHLPQLFVLLAITKFVINFLRFIAICTQHSGYAFLAAGEDWFQITSWIIFLLMNLLCFTYMFFVKRCVRAAAASTVLFFITFVSFFEAPLTTSHSSRAFQGTFTFFRGILIVIITGMYVLAYRQEIVPPRDHLPSRARIFVVKNRTDLPLPTLPRIFVHLALTEFAINFFRFIAICAEDFGYAFLAAGEDWFQVGSWIVFLLMNMLCLTYMFSVKQRVRAAVASTIFFFITFVSFFEAPLTTSYYTRAFQGTFTFFRGILIVIITGMYALAYRQEIVPPRDHLPAWALARNEVKNGTDIS